MSTSRRRWRAAAALVLVGMLAVAGCTGDSGDEPERAEGPLSEFLGFSALERTAPGLPQLSEQDEVRQRALQELVASCMADAGFEYVPVSIADQLASAFGDAYALAPAEFAQEYGYGITTLELDGPDPAAVDPNEAVRDGLPPEQQAEYDAVLWGDADGPGCYAAATTEVFGGPDDPAVGLAEFQDLFDALTGLFERIEEDPRLVAAYEEWAGCLDEAGYPGLSVPEDAPQAVYERLAQVPGTDPAGLAEVREFELAIAPADYACQREHLAGPYAEVVTELEGEFVAEHREVLERYQEWLAR